MRYQNTSLNPSKSLLPRLTQRSDTIIAGDSVAIYPQLITGPVVVKKDSIVRFQSANTILLIPGFSVDTGGVFIAEIGDCQRSDSTNIDYGIESPWHTGSDGALTLLKCNYDSIFNCLNFQSIGATHYHVILLNAHSREIFYEAEGEVHDMITPFFCGNGASGASPQSDPIEVVLQLFNCANTKLFDWEINIEYNVSGGCSPAAKTNELNFSSPKPNSILIYPNPASDLIYVSSGHSDIQAIEIINDLGQFVLQRKIDASSNSVNLDIQNFADGIYICKVMTTDETATKRIIIKK